jgi:predicted nuclease of predicted toxin-antitoxin system
MTLKLLLDENLSRRIVPFIQESYPESTQVALIGLEQMNDKEIRQYAIDNDFVIATKDADFYEMNLLYGQLPKIIWLKMGNQLKAATINALINHKDFIYQALVVEDKECVEIF